MFVYNLYLCFIMANRHIYRKPQPYKTQFGWRVALNGRPTRLSELARHFDDQHLPSSTRMPQFYFNRPLSAFEIGGLVNTMLDDPLITPRRVCAAAYVIAALDLVRTTYDEKRYGSVLDYIRTALRAAKKNIAPQIVIAALEITNKRISPLVYGGKGLQPEKQLVTLMGMCTSPEETERMTTLLALSRAEIEMYGVNKQWPRDLDHETESFSELVSRFDDMVIPSEPPTIPYRIIRRPLNEEERKRLLGLIAPEQNEILTCAAIYFALQLGIEDTFEIVNDRYSEAGILLPSTLTTSTLALTLNQQDWIRSRLIRQQDQISRLTGMFYSPYKGEQNIARIVMDAANLDFTKSQ